MVDLELLLRGHLQKGPPSYGKSQVGSASRVALIPAALHTFAKVGFRYHGSAKQPSETKLWTTPLMLRHRISSAGLSLALAYNPDWRSPSWYAQSFKKPVTKE